MVMTEKIGRKALLLSLSIIIVLSIFIGSNCLLDTKGQILLNIFMIETAEASYDPLLYAVDPIRHDEDLQDIIEKAINDFNVDIEDLFYDQQDLILMEFKEALQSYLNVRTIFWSVTPSARMDVYNIMLDSDVDIDGALSDAISDFVYETTSKSLQFIEEEVEKDHEFTGEHLIVADLEKTLESILEEARILAEDYRNELEKLEQSLEDVTEEEGLTILQNALVEGRIFFNEYMDLMEVISPEDYTLFEENMQKHTEVFYHTYEAKDMIADIAYDERTIEESYSWLYDKSLRFIEDIFEMSGPVFFEEMGLSIIEMHASYMEDEDYEYDDQSMDNVKELLLQIDTDRGFVFFTIEEYIVFCEEIMVLLETVHFPDLTAKIATAFTKLPLMSADSVRQHIGKASEEEEEFIDWLSKELEKHIGELEVLIDELEKEEDIVVDEDWDDMIRHVRQAQVFAGYFYNRIVYDFEEEYYRLLQVFIRFEDIGFS